MFRKPTDKNMTFHVMEHYLLPDGKIDGDYLNDQIQIVLMNTARLRRKISKKIPAMNIILEVMCEIANGLLEWSEENMYASRDYQMESWLNEFGDGIKTVQPSIELVNRVRRKEWGIC